VDFSKPATASPSVYHDLNSLNKLKSNNPQGEREALRAAVKEFEAYFLNLMLKNMRSANKLLNEDSPLNSSDVEYYNEMHDQQLAVNLSRSSQFGIGDLLFKQLSAHLPKDSSEKQQAQVRLPNYSDVSLGKNVDSNHTGFNQSNKVNNSPNTNSSESYNVNPLMTMNASVRNLLVNPEQSKDLLAKQAVENNAAVSVNNSQLNQSNIGKAVSGKDDFSLSFASKSDFIDKIKPYAVSAAKAIGTHPGILIAQAALETGWGQFFGKNEQGKSSLNLFGIKADSRWSGESVATPTLEFKQGIPEKITQSFRAYDSLEQSFNDYVDFILNNPRYKNALNESSDPESYIQQIQSGGYATDPDYAEKIKSIFNRESLFNITSEKP
jgi:flagellar protein FlgJ